MTTTFCLGDYNLHNVPFFFIAEAGINHNGTIENAKKLIDLALESGADCVKFQKRTIDRILTKEGLEMPYNNDNSFGETYGKHKHFLEFSFPQFKELKDYADQKGIMMTASGWDEQSVDFLDSLDVPFFKMASADLTNFPLLEHTAKKGRPMIISTGMADFKTVRKAYDLISKYNDKIIIMQCTSSYPTPPKELHLNVIATYQKEFPKAIIGYSGHEKNPLATTLAAFVLGAKVLERHFTLDRTMRGGDHKASLEGNELKNLIENLELVSDALGSHEKKMQPSEDRCFKKLSKSVVSAKNIKAGETITRDMLTTKGPGTGISPMNLESLVNKTVNCDIMEDVLIKPEWLN